MTPQKNTTLPGDRKNQKQAKKQDGGQTDASDNTTEVESQPETNETESTSSADSFDVPAINFKRYLGTTGVRYIQMGQASHIQGENKWDLEETIRQAEQKLHHGFENNCHRNN